MNFSNPAGSVTTRLRASGDVTVKVWGMSRGPYTNDPAGCLDDPAPNPERQFALKNIEPLILAVMNVQRRPGALPPQQLSHRHAPGDRFTAGLDDCQRAEEPKSRRTEEPKNRRTKEPLLLLASGRWGLGLVLQAWTQFLRSVADSNFRLGHPTCGVYTSLCSPPQRFLSRAGR